MILLVLEELSLIFTTALVFTRFSDNRINPNQNFFCTYLFNNDFLNQKMKTRISNFNYKYQNNNNVINYTKISKYTQSKPFRHSDFNVNLRKMKVFKTPS